MQNKPFPWIGSILAIAAMLAVAWVSSSVASLEPPNRGARALQGSRDLRQVEEEDSASLAPRGVEDGPDARSESRRLDMERAEVALSPSAKALARAAEAYRTEFEATALEADLPDERGETDREFMAQVELDEIEESLELTELEEALVGAERTAVMHASLQAALGER